MEYKINFGQVDISIYYDSFWWCHNNLIENIDWKYTGVGKFEFNDRCIYLTFMIIWL